MTDIEKSRPPILLFIGLFSVFIILLLRDSGLNPVVMSDEWAYSRMARLVPFSEAYVPSFLYLPVFNLTNLCGEGFLSCARILNAVLFITGCLFVYFVAERATTRNLAAYITLLTALGPINSYTAYFMPEASFFFGFWFFTWSLLRITPLGQPFAIVGPSVAFGLLCVIKAHGIFMYPAVFIYLLFLHRSEVRKVSLRNAASSIAAFTLISILVKLAVGFAIAGKTGLTLLGSSYGGMVANGGGSLDKYVELTKYMGTNLWGHLMILALLFGAAISVVFQNVASSLWRTGPLSEEAKISLYAMFSLASLIIVSSAFTAMAKSLGPYESLYRVHMRYYNFALPLFLIAAAANYQKNQSAGGRLATIAGVVLAGTALIATASRITPYDPQFVDAPDAVAAILRPNYFFLAALIALLPTIAWILPTARRSALFIFLFATTPLMVIVNGEATNLILRSVLAPSVFDRAGKFVREEYDDNDRAKFSVISKEPAGSYKALFHIDSATAQYVDGSSFEENKIKEQLSAGRIVLLIGIAPNPKEGMTITTLNGFSVVKKAD